MNTATAPEESRKVISHRCGFLVVKETTLLPRRSVARGGPVPRLVRGGRWDLPAWLLLVAAATPEGALVDLQWYRKFASRCLGLPDAQGSTTRSTVARMLGRLQALHLIEFEERRPGRVIVRLLALDGSGSQYAMPHRAETKVVHVPTGLLFGNGWHSQLSQIELAGLLIALTEETWQFRKFSAHQWEKSRDRISKDYGLAASTWSKAKEGLLGYGLLEWDLPQLPTGSRPERVPEDRYTVHTEPLEVTPDRAPRYAPIHLPITVTAPGTGAKLRMHRQTRVRLAPSSPAERLRVANIRRDA